MRSPSRPQRVLVIGAGIAGLAAAHALGRKGIECDVIERSPIVNLSGTGMFLPADGARALRALGVLDAVRERAREITRQVFHNHRGHQLLDVDLGQAWGRVGPCLGVARSDLHAVLRAEISVRAGVRVGSLHDDGTRVHALFQDGTSAGYDLVLGADGLRSWVRTTVLAGSRSRFLGQLSWRFIVEGRPGTSSWTVWLGPGRAALTVPLAGERLYCYLDLNTPEEDACLERSAVQELFSRFADPVPSIVAAGLKPERTLHRAPIEEVPPGPWVRGRIALIGDAAHGMSPNLAHGATLALEDALVLADTVCGGGSVADYQARRRPRVAYVRAQTRRRERLRRAPGSIRDATLRLAGRQIVEHGYAPLRAEP